MISKQCLRLVSLMERGGRRFESRGTGRHSFVTVWDGDAIVGIGVGSNVNDAVIRCAKMMVDERPIGDLSTELTRQQQRGNIKWVKKIVL